MFTPGNKFNLKHRGSLLNKHEKAYTGCGALNFSATLANMANDGKRRKV